MSQSVISAVLNENNSFSFVAIVNEIRNEMIALNETHWREQEILFVSVEIANKKNCRTIRFLALFLFLPIGALVFILHNLNLNETASRDEKVYKSPFQLSV